MNTLRKSLIIGMTVIGMGSAAFSAHAQDAAAKPRHAYAETKFDPAKFAERRAARQQKLHDALKLNAAQETAWQHYMAAIKPQMPAGRPDRVDFKSLSAPEKMEKMLERSKMRIERQEAHLSALKTFYAVLTPEQQKTFDQMVARHGRGHRHHGGAQQ
ncbi:Spy/CpxP family protein refolding chaperone [Massilia endophytica]|uniref:Spy/CpxP family protein refolding chaperone n=1 Tax=Massilia endophytica TaxID=2899220 RepID=UPI001E3D63B5|nr:Spy/CpxP family protein refolding chaperone [Massilia endophytica]UGQ46759.1 Spy/CpxP family protein refolding chaperone [Massilia endophytica]